MPINDSKENLLVDEKDVIEDADKPPPNLASVCPPGITKLLSQRIYGNQSMEHNQKSITKYLQKITDFVKLRMGDKIKLQIQCLEVGNQALSSEKLKSKLISEGYYMKDWNRRRLTRQELSAALESIANLHAAGLAFRMSNKKDIDNPKPKFAQDIFTSSITKELVAKHIDSYLHCLSSLPDSEKIVKKLKLMEPYVFQYLLNLGRPTDELASRFSTLCHGNLWQGNLLFKPKTSGEGVDCALVDFNFVGQRSPASDLAHLVLTSYPPELLTLHWSQIVEEYYNKFNTTLCRFGLVLRHLGTSYNHFQQEVSRALAGEFLVAVILIPILAMFGPEELQETRRSSWSGERENTIRHLVQMMAITETEDEDNELGNKLETIQEKFFNHPSLCQYVKDLLLVGSSLNVLDTIKPDPKPRSSSWIKTKQTTGKYKPTYSDKHKNNYSTAIGSCG